MSGNRYIFILFLITSVFTSSFGQIHIGPKAGFQSYLPIYKYAAKYMDISPLPKIGYNIGLCLDYKANNTFSFYTDLTYSHKGKLLTGGIKNRFKNNAVYKYIEMPVLMKLTFHEHNKEGIFTWFLEGGGSMSYWLSGKGYISSFELQETAIEKSDYLIKYKPKTTNEFDDIFTIYLSEPNRIQVGLVFGGGILIPVSPGRTLSLDLRYTFRQTWLARDREVDVGLYEYFEDFRTMEHNVSLNLAYMFEYNLGQGRQGKSTKGRKIKTKKIQKPFKSKKTNINKIKKNK